MEVSHIVYVRKKSTSGVGYLTPSHELVRTRVDRGSATSSRQGSYEFLVTFDEVTLLEISISMTAIILTETRKHLLLLVQTPSALVSFGVVLHVHNCHTVSYVYVN